MKFRKITLFAFVFLAFQTVNAQIDLATPMAVSKGGAATAIVKNWEAIGINPANLGWKNNYRFSLSILNAGINLQSKALDFQSLENAVSNPNQTFTPEQKKQYASLFTTSDGLNLEADITWLAASVSIPKVGGFAINVRDRMIGHIGLSQNAADILFNGVNSQAYQDSNITSKLISQELAGTNISYYHYRELNIDYGRKLFSLGDSASGKGIDIFGGLGFKYLWGLGDLETNITDAGVDAHSSFSTIYNIDYGSIQNFSPQNAGNLFNSVGHGTAFDLGLSAVIHNKLTVGISATDLGQIHWTHNLLTAVDTTMPKLNSGNNGLESWNFGNSGFTLGNNSIVDFKSGPDYNIALPSKLRMGASFQLTSKIIIASDAVFPLNTVGGNLENPYYALGGEITLNSFFKFSTGVAGNSNYGISVPIGITLSAHNFIEFFLATDDVLTYLEKSKNPHISMAIGVLRFNIK
ncbi:MAG: DUF5723 family protein [Bacteroidia bacterium]